MAILPDAAARETILDNLDANLVVEAAAGTGKTTCLVGRIMNLFRTGHHRIAAVTFTHKAASELRERLEKRLGQSLVDPGLSEEEKAHLAQAQKLLPECHIGTIHSFCARLLRERPVEAGIGPDFRELDDSEDLFLRAQAWNEFARQLGGGEYRDLYRIFETFGLDLDTLGDSFRKFADFPDIEEWPGRDAGMHQIDADAFMTGVDAYYQSLRPLHAALENADPGTDALLPVLQILVRRYPRLHPPLALADAYRLSGLFKKNPKITQKQWLLFAMDKDAALGEQARYLRFHEDTVVPFRNQCLAAVYAAALQAYQTARDIYDRLRLESGVLNFQDLLMAAAAMLREYPEVRADLAGRYRRLLIDEVQDTDPVQAEIMFLLASDAFSERDWRKCPPRPGALFIVGDPKQSIYRFRRADIVVYQEIKKRIVDCGGEVLGLSTNFRSQPAILDWVNATYCLPPGTGKTPEEVAASGCFSLDESPHSPGYVALRPGLGEAPPGSFHGVYYLETIPVSKKDGVKEKDVVRDEADRIAAFIRHAVDSGMPIPEGSKTRPAHAGDFMVVTYEKPDAAVYAAALRAMGLECRVSSGGTLRNSKSLCLLREYLTALDNPEDGVQLLAVLRGELFGVSDPELYAWRKKGREFSFLAIHPEGDDAIGNILAILRKHWELFRRTDPALAVETVLEDLGLWAYSALGDDPSTQAGTVAAALELLRSEREELPTLGGLIERLVWHMEHYEKDPLPAAAGRGQAVRVMNLHKTKGLEAPVVFLTCTRGLRRHEAAFAVRRRAGKTSAGLALRGGLYGGTLLARPGEWDRLAEEEELFLAAEKTRLNYVAATRAGAALVVSVHMTNKVWKSAFLPCFVKGETIEKALPEPEMRPEARFDGVLDAIDGDGLLESAAAREAAREALLRPSYRVERAKPDFVPAIPAGDSGRTEDIFEGEAPLELGEVLHRLLQEDLSEVQTRDMAAVLLRDFSLPPGWLDDVADMVAQVKTSAVWQRAAAAERAYREAPFTVTALEDGLPVIRRGVIDLVFREEKGWIVVDYKSDLVGDGQVDAAARRHQAQLKAYAKAWECIIGEKVAETGIYFLRNGVYVPVETETQGTLFA